jgi:hypothetical protein
VSAQAVLAQTKDFAYRKSNRVNGIERCQGILKHHLNMTAKRPELRLAQLMNVLTKQPDLAGVDAMEMDHHTSKS